MTGLKYTSLVLVKFKHNNNYELKKTSLFFMKQKDLFELDFCNGRRLLAFKGFYREK